MLQYPIAAIVNPISAAIRLCAIAAHPNPIALSTRHPAICHRRSPVRSLDQPTITVNTAAARYGIVAYRAITLAALAESAVPLPPPNPEPRCAKLFSTSGIQRFTVYVPTPSRKNTAASTHTIGILNASRSRCRSVAPPSVPVLLELGIQPLLLRFRQPRRIVRLIPQQEQHRHPHQSRRNPLHQEQPLPPMQPVKPLQLQQHARDRSPHYPRNRGRRHKLRHRPRPAPATETSTSGTESSPERTPPQLTPRKNRIA